MENKEKFSLKDHLFNIPKVEKIAGEIHSVYQEFNKQAFIKDVISEFPKLELKARIDHIRDMFHRYLPDDYKIALKILLQSLPAELDPEKAERKGDELHHQSCVAHADKRRRSRYHEISGIEGYGL